LPNQSQEQQASRLVKEEASSLVEFFPDRDDSRGMNPQLNEMNLVGGEEPISQPDDYGRRSEMTRRQIISSRSSGAQCDGARQLGVHASFPAEFFQDGLKKKSCRRGRA
jgi:hypothetical protein